MLHVVPQSAHLCAGPSKSGGNNRETMIKLQNEVFPYSIGAQLVKRYKPFALNFLSLHSELSQRNYTSSPTYEPFGSWKKPRYVKITLVELY